ncbi:MAG TPA: hypothetical protein DCF68_01975 [Cyanothece sp. UBA12306]|nr:hypothetical protein [Cyanothece sp. UBA12306]
MKKFSCFCYLLLWLSLGGCAEQTPSRVATPVPSSVPEKIEETAMENNNPPPMVIDAVRQQVSKLTDVTPEQLQMKESLAKTWPDGCLGLAKADEFCTQALVEGWRIVITDGQKTWIYRTNAQGSAIRLESES